MKFENTNNNRWWKKTAPQAKIVWFQDATLGILPYKMSAAGEFFLRLQDVTRGIFPYKMNAAGDFFRFRGINKHPLQFGEIRETNKHPPIFLDSHFLLLISTPQIGQNLVP